MKQGLTAESIRWAFSTSHASNWHPITWLSHMLDVELFGMDPVGHHAMSALLHLGAVLAFFAALRSLSGRTLPSALAAALFAVHPLRVESVAWAAERKDVLGMLFGMLSIWAYAGYARRGGVGRYLAVAAGMTFSLMSKPTFVCLPAILLLLDAWPLRRHRSGLARSWGSLVLEKLPLAAIAVVSALVTLSVQRQAMAAMVQSDLPLRAANALVSCVRYLGLTAWPSRLAVFHPHPQLPGGTPWGLEQVAGATLLVALLSAAAIAVARRQPYWLVGWLWFLVALLPVIGLVQVGNQAMADRYTYLPHAGLFAALSFGAVDGVAALSRRWPMARAAGLSVAACVLVALVFATRAELGYWRDGLRLFERASAVTPPNPITRDNLGSAYLEAGRVAEAIEEYRAAISLAPHFAVAHHNLGTALQRSGRVAEALDSFERALALDPDYALARTNFATALAEQGRIDEAIDQYRRALETSPGFARAHHQLGIALLRRGDVEEAVRQLRFAVRADPLEPEAHFNLAGLLRTPDRVEEALVHYREGLRLQPDNARAHYDLATTLQLRGELDAAITHYRESLRVEPDYAPAHNNLGSALRAQGRIDEAIVHFREALRIDPDHEKARRNLERALAQ